MIESRQESSLSIGDRKPASRAAGGIINAVCFFHGVESREAFLASAIHAAWRIAYPMDAAPSERRAATSGVACA